MNRTDIHLSETDIRSPGSRLYTVRADAGDQRPWIQDAPICPLLNQFQIVHLGLGRMTPPFEMVRTKLEGSYFLASISGQGRVLVDGRWQACRPGTAFLLPPGMLHAFHAEPDQHWEFCWVRYAEIEEQLPIAFSHSPVVADYDGEPLRLAIQGLHHESRAKTPSPVVLDQWVRLIHEYVLLFAQPQGIDQRIFRLWEKVEADLSFDWTSEKMARTVHLSQKQLERLCRRELGRTPRQQLIWLRMRQAAHLLSTRNDKIETISAEVGYENPFVFSRTFKRCMGWPPSEYPGRKREIL